MYNAEDDNQSVWQQFMAEIAGQTPQPEVSDGVDRGELRNVPKEMLENYRQYTYNPDQPLGEGVLKLLADNTTTANDAQPRGLNAYRESGASVKPAKSAAEVYNQLHPEAASRIKRFFELAEERGLGLKPGSMNRDYGTQAKMYADKQANRRGAYQSLPVAPPGSSTHMGFATDFSGYTPQKLEAIRELAREVGLVYGGNWNGKTFDPVHIQLGPGSDVTRYIQQHIDPKAGTVNWEGVRSTQLPEDFIKRALAAAGGQDVNATYVPVKEVKVEGAANASGDVTARSEASQYDDKVAEAAPSKRGKEFDYVRLLKVLGGDSENTKGGDTYLQRALQSGAQSHQAARAKTSTQIAQFDQEQVQNLAQALKSGKLPSKRYKEGGEVEGEDTPNIDKIIENLIKERTTEAEIIDNGFKPRDYDPAKITQALSIMSGRAKDPSTDLRAHYNIGKLGLNAGVMQSDKFRGYNAGVNLPLNDTSSIGINGNYGRVMGAYGKESPASWGVRGEYIKRFNEGGEVHGYNDGGPKLPDRPEYEVAENPDAVDASPAGAWERMFARVTGGRNLQNDIANIKSRLPTGQDYGHALLEQREATQGLNALSGQNIREGYANRDIPQMALGAGQGALGLVNPALAPINAGFEVLSKTAGKFDPRAKVEAELLGLVGTEGTGVTQKLHNLELPKSSWDALLKKYQDAGPQAMTIGLPAAAAAAEKPVEAAIKLGVEPKGNVNLRPMIDASALKGPEVQTVESFLSQIRGMPGVTKEGFDALVQKYQGMEPNARISKADFEKSIPPSEYGKIDLIKEFENFDRTQLPYFKEATERAKNEIKNDPNLLKDIDKNVSKKLQSYTDGWGIDLGVLRKFNDGALISEFRGDQKEMLMALKSMLGEGQEKRLREAIRKTYESELNEAIHWVRDDIIHSDITDGVIHEGNLEPRKYDNDQRLIVHPDANEIWGGTDHNSPNYFELGVTHPNQKEEYGHYAHINPNRPEGGMIAHIRGELMPEGGQLSTKDNVIATKPNSAVIEEIQSDTGKEKSSPELHQIHATGFKTGVQHALENGATTVYLPTADTIASVRTLDLGQPAKASRFAPIYDQEIVKYGLKPLLQIKGVTSKMVGDSAYHEISFTPAAIEAILKGKGQRTPGYADGGIVTDNGQTPDGTGRNQYSAFGDLSEAQGGQVRAVEYDPNRISTMAQQLQEGTYA